MDGRGGGCRGGVLALPLPAHVPRHDRRIDCRPGAAIVSGAGRLAPSSREGRRTRGCPGRGLQLGRGIFESVPPRVRDESGSLSHRLIASVLCQPGVTGQVRPWRRAPGRRSANRRHQHGYPHRDHRRHQRGPHPPCRPLQRSGPVLWPPVRVGGQRRRDAGTYSHPLIRRSRRCCAGEPAFRCLSRAHNRRIAAARHHPRHVACGALRHPHPPWFLRRYCGRIPADVLTLVAAKRRGHRRLPGHGDLPELAA